MSELVFEVTQDADGGYIAEALGENIVTEADSWDELRANVREAVEAYYFEEPKPAQIRLALRRDEVLAVARSSRAMSTGSGSQTIFAASGIMSASRSWQSYYVAD